jgi:hypothetical protein
VLSGDVGYAFRPLDVLQRESRLQLAPPPLSGIPMIAWDNFGADSAWSLILANPGHGPAMRQHGGARDDSSLALRLRRSFAVVAGADFHGVARSSARNGLELGRRLRGGAGRGASNCMASLLLQQRGERRVPLAARGRRGAVARRRATALQVESRPGRVGKALLGATWTAESGISRWAKSGGTAAPTHRRRLAAAGTNAAAARNALRGLPGVPDIAVAGANAASTRIFEQGNLARRGLLARLAWSQPGGGWSLSADLLRSLDDGGTTLTAAASWQGDQLRLDAGLRRYGGRADSAYRLLPEAATAFVGVSLAY